MNKGIFKVAISVTTSLLAQVAHVQPAAAQDVSDAGEANAANGEIIVTAQKRSERLSEAPLSITAASGEQLARTGVTAPADLIKIVPGFTYQPSNYGPPVFGIRGISFTDSATAAAPTVSVYLDQVSLPYLVMTPGTMLDLERVEVMKGPQGTLFGQNSTGGAINFIAAKPTKEFAAGASAEYARFDQVNLEGFVSGPLTDTLGVRVAARTEQGGAWQKSQTRPADKLGDRNFTTGRIILDWKPSDTVRFEFNANGFIDKSDTLAAQYVKFAPTVPAVVSPLATIAENAIIASGNTRAPHDNRIADWGAFDNYRNDNKFYQLSLRGDIDLSDTITLTSLTAYSDLDYDSLVDPDGVTLGNVTPRSLSTIKSFSQELRLSGSALGESLKWMVGGNYGHDKTKESQVVSIELASNSALPTGAWINTPVQTFMPSIVNVNNHDVDTYAVFGSLDYNLSPEWTISASARYTKRNDDAAGCLADPGDGRLANAFNLAFGGTALPGNCITFNAATFAQVGLVEVPLHEDNVSWRANISWKPNSDVHLYANVTKGYKAGAFTTNPIVFDVQYFPVKQESVVAYEAGFKVAVLDRIMRLSGAVFHYDYSDKQLAGYNLIPPFGNLPALIAVPKSRVNGAELSIDVRPVEGLTLNAAATYVDTKVKRGTAYDPFANLIDVAGEAFPITPKWQLMGDAEYRFPISAGLVAFAGANVSYRSSTTSAFGGDADFALPSYALVDLRAGIEAEDGRWGVQVWGRNVFNQFYATNVSHVIDTVARTAGRPATYGVKLNFRY